MARLLVELKLRLVRNALRSSTPAQVSFIISTVCAALVAIGTFWLLAQLRSQTASVDLTTVIFGIFAIGWLIAPIFAFGLDGTLDPATMALYPLRTRQLVPGLLAASAVGPWPAANVLGLLGVTIGLARGALGVLVAFIAVVLQVLFCIVLARFVTTSIGAAASLAPRQGPRRLPDRPDLRRLRVPHPGDTPGRLLWAVSARRASPASTAGCAGCRPAWPRTRSRTPRPGTRVTPRRASARWRPSSSCSACCGCARSAGPWSPRTPLPGHRGCAMPRCRWRGTACEAPWPPGS